MELQNGGLLGVLSSALDAETVDAAVEVGLGERVVPCRARGWCRSTRIGSYHRLSEWGGTLRESVADAAVSDGLLSLLKLLQESEFADNGYLNTYVLVINSRS